MDSKPNHGWWKSLLQRSFWSRHKTRNEQLGSNQVGEATGQAGPPVKPYIIVLEDEDTGEVYNIEIVCGCESVVIDLGDGHYSCLHCDTVCTEQDCGKCIMLFAADYSEIEDEEEDESGL